MPPPLVVRVQQRRRQRVVPEHVRLRERLFVQWGVFKISAREWRKGKNQVPSQPFPYTHMYTGARTDRLVGDEEDVGVGLAVEDGLDRRVGRGARAQDHVLVVILHLARRVLPGQLRLAV